MKFMFALQDAQARPHCTWLLLGAMLGQSKNCSAPLDSFAKLWIMKAEISVAAWPGDGGRDLKTFDLRATDVEVRQMQDRPFAKPRSVTRFVNDVVKSEVSGLGVWIAAKCADQSRLMNIPTDAVWDS